MPLDLIAVIVVTLALAALAWYLVRNRKTSSRSSKALDLDAWQPRTIKPLTKIELNALASLKATVTECHILPQVSLSRFIKVKSSMPYGPWFYRVGRRCVDFLVCSDKGDVLGVVELIQGKNADATSARGAQSKAHVLKQASIPVWHVDPDAPDGYSQLRKLIYAELGESEAHTSLKNQWQPTDIAPRKAGIEALELDDDRWNQPWPTEDSGPTSFLDFADTAASEDTPVNEKSMTG